MCGTDDATLWKPVVLQWPEIGRLLMEQAAGRKRILEECRPLQFSLQRLNMLVLERRGRERTFLEESDQHSFIRSPPSTQTHSDHGDGELSLTTASSAYLDALRLQGM